MKRNVSNSDIDRRSMMEESVFLRIQQLQMGLLQFTDPSNAYRLSG